MNSALPAGGLVSDSSRAAIWQGMKLALPLAATGAITCLIGAVDMVLAGAAGQADQAALGIGDQVIFATVLLGTGLGTAITSEISRALGQNDPELARNQSRCGMFIAAICGLLATVACFASAHAVFEALGCTSDVLHSGAFYLKICALANLPFMLMMAECAILRSYLNSHRCFQIWLTAAVISIGGGILLWYLPTNLRFSLSALAVAWVAGSLAGAIYGWQQLIALNILSSHSISKLSGRQVVSCVRTLLSLAAPAVLAEACILCSNFGLYRIASLHQQSSAVQAALSVLLKIEETAALVPLLALSATTAILVGHNLGAGNKHDARRIALLMSLASVALMTLLAIPMLACARQIAPVFSQDSQVAGLVASGLGYIALSLPPLALATVILGAFEGAGRMIPGLVLQSGAKFAIRLPLALALISYGAVGLCAAVLISRVAAGFATIILFFKSFTDSSAVRQ